MSLQFYSEIRGSLNSKSHKKINSETLKRLYQLFIREKNFFEKNHEYTLGINNPSYTERSLFSTLNGYTSTELFMNRLSPLEKKNVIILTDLISNGVIKKIRYHDFDSLIAIGSSTYSDSYRSELQSAVDDIHYEVINTSKKEVVEDWNTSYEYITKEQIQETMNKKGNDIDLVLTGFSGGGIGSNYRSYYKNTIGDTITKHHHRDYIKTILGQFIYKEISQEQFFSLVLIDDIVGFKKFYEELQNNNEHGAEEFLGELLKKYNITLSEKGIKEVPPITDEIIKHFLTIKKTIVSQEEFIRNTYLHELIPDILQTNQISFIIEEHREDGSYYHIDHKNKTITKQKYLNPDQSKNGCLIIKFPDCRPIHLNIDTSTIEELYHHEQRYNGFFSILFHNFQERDKFLSTDWSQINNIPEKLSLEKQIQYIRQNKPKINWERIIERRKKESTRAEDENELNF